MFQLTSLRDFTARNETVKLKLQLNVLDNYIESKFKEGLQSVLRIGSAHNKGGPPNINIVQISHFSNPFLIETLVYIHL